MYLLLTYRGHYIWQTFLTFLSSACLHWRTFRKTLDNHWGFLQDSELTGSVLYKGHGSNQGSTVCVLCEFSLIHENRVRERDVSLWSASCSFFKFIFWVVSSRMCRWRVGPPPPLSVQTCLDLHAHTHTHVPLTVQRLKVFISTFF